MEYEIAGDEFLDDVAVRVEDLLDACLRARDRIRDARAQAPVARAGVRDAVGEAQPLALHRVLDTELQGNDGPQVRQQARAGRRLRGLLDAVELLAFHRASRERGGCCDSKNADQ